ncbi:MAG: hypothetical protein CL583_15425 [Alteromonadaceae bacterium]|nr:hypothetical protein [Alteromonadaceae bacterium]|tara:strand:+ start:2735 stop:3775 length:1041 start_codon:yes stop_codon:yes gene_type:complete
MNRRLAALVLPALTFPSVVPGLLARVTVLLFCFFCFAGQSLAAGTGYVFVSHERSHTVAVLDPSKGHEVIRTIDTCNRPRDMHFDESHERLYVACGDDDVIEVIDVAKLEVIDRIETGRSPEVFAISPDGESLYVSEEESSIVRQIDMETNETLAEITTGPEPEGVLLTQDGARLFVTSEIADMVHVVDTATGKVEKNIVVGTRPRRFEMNQDHSELWVTDELAGQVSIIDTENLELLHQLPMVPPGFRPSEVTPVGLDLSADGKTMYVTLGRANHVAFVDADTREVLDYVLVGSRAWGVAASKDGKFLYVANGLSDDTTVVDVESRSAVKSIPTGRVPHTVVIDD